MTKGTGPVITGATQVFALLGHPVAHSLSPAIYNPLFEEHGVDAVYVAFEVPPTEGAQLGSIIRTLGLSGVNLTVPFKADILDALDEVDPVAQALGAVNVVVRRGQRLVGYNTDASGFCQGLRADTGAELRGAKAIVLGAGGAGRAVGMGLASAGAAEVVWLNRTEGRALDAVERGRAHIGSCRFAAGPLSPEGFAAHAASADVVVQCTSGAGGGAVNLLDVGLLPAHGIWCDINYWMDAPPRWDACLERGLRCHHGLHMLVYQAVEAFALFTGLQVDPMQILARLR